MVEALIGFIVIGGIMLGFFLFYEKGLHLSVYERELRKVPLVDGAGPSFLLLNRVNDQPPQYAGFALYDGPQKLLCYNGGPRLLCRYDEILEWRVLINQRSVVCLSKLTSADLKVEEPDRTLSTEAFLRHYCDDQRQDPSLESITMKFLIRNLGSPVHMISLDCLEKRPGKEDCMAQAFGFIDKFKIIMYPKSA